jgi:DNA-binding transcriptional MerR regulator
MATGDKDPGAFRTIGELSSELGVAQHILRYWETKFPQLRPLQRAGNRRYYRPADVELARTIHRLLNSEGYTVRGVQKLLRSKEGGHEFAQAVQVAQAAQPAPQAVSSSVDVDRLKALRNRLASLLAD